MATIAEAVAAALANFPGYQDELVGDWTLKFGVQGVSPFREYGRLSFVVPNGNGGFTPVITPLLATDRGLPTEACLCNLATVETDAARFQRLAREWCVARVDSGWFVSEPQWGPECALVWGLNVSGVTQTAMLTWATSEKLAIKADLGFPVPGAPVDTFSAKVTLANDTTEIDFAGGRFKQLTVTGNRVLTTTVTPSNTEATLVIVTTGTTSRNITFGTGFGRTQGTLATGTTGGIVYVIQFISDGTNMHEVSRTAGMAA